jgi:hypothetical protein
VSVINLKGRYIVFIYDNYYPGGGMSDAAMQGDDLEVLRGLVKRLRNGEGDVRPPEGVTNLLNPTPNQWQINKFGPDWVPPLYGGDHFEIYDRLADEEVS